MDKIICLTLGQIGTNCYLFSYSGCLCVVDPAEDNSELFDTINDVCSEYKLEFTSIFLTHGHLDHLSGIRQLKKIYPNVKIYISKHDKNYVGKGSYNFQYEIFASGGMGFFVSQMLADKKDLPDADVFFDDGDVLFPDENFGSWKVIATPGHTKGSCCLYNENRKLIFTGDTLMFYSCGRTDMKDGSNFEMQKSLEKLSLLPPQ